MTDESQQAPQERPLWALNRDDQRNLLITLAATFAGGVASIVVGAAVIGLAYAVARGGAPAVRGTSGIAYTAGVLGITILAVVACSRQGLRRTPWLWGLLLLLVPIIG